MKRWGWKLSLLAFGITGILTIIALFLFAEVTSQPGFCVSCHYMRPYFTSWQESSHKDIACTMCHFPPGFQNAVKQKFVASSMVVNYVTGIYKRSKPWAEVDDGSCLRPGCHETRLLDGRVPFKEGIIFDHKPHLSELRLGKILRCTSCHSQIVQGEHIAVTETACFLCHFRGDPDGTLSNCQKCHDAPVRTAANPNPSFDHSRILEQEVSCLRCHGNMQVGSGEVRRERCSFCHAEIGKIDRFNDTPFLHKVHISDRKVECTNCHQEILHHSVSRTEEVKPSCEDCHPGYHQVQVDLFTGQGGRGVEPLPSTMFESGLNCRGCHIQPTVADNFAPKGTTFTASGVVCTPCHDPGYDRILDGWKRRNNERVDQIRRIEKTVTANVTSLKNVHRTAADSLVAAARYNIDMVSLGHGIHNIPFAEALLGEAYRQLSAANKLAAPGQSLPKFDIGLPKTDADCMNCHYGVETMVVQRVKGNPFPHASHVIAQKLACTRCHDNSVKHGALSLSKDQCNECHHKPHDEKPADCQKCHALQTSLYTGDKSWGENTPPDVMAEAGMSCADCHTGENNTIRRPDGETCTGCHEPQYAALLEEWKKETATLLTTNDSLLTFCRNVKLPEMENTRRRTGRIRSDRSFGVHNHAHIIALLKADRAYLEKFIADHQLGIAPHPGVK